MNRTLQFVLAAAFSVTIVATACRPAENKTAQDKGTPTPSVSEQEKPGTESSSDISPVVAEIRIDDVVLGYAVAADDSIPSEQRGDEFAHEPAYVAMKVEDTPAGSAVKTVWFGPGEVRVHEEVKTVAPGQGHLSFKADTSAWPKGDYRVEVWLGDEKVATEHLNVVDSREGQA